jgi:hypothetical protein
METFKAKFKLQPHNPTTTKLHATYGSARDSSTRIIPRTYRPGTAGQVVDFAFDVRAPHAGTANVSIVNTVTNSIVGETLLYYANFANNAYPTPANQTSFSSLFCLSFKTLPVSPRLESGCYPSMQNPCLCED